MSELSEAFKFMADYAKTESLVSKLEDWANENKPVEINVEDLAKHMVSDVHDVANGWDAMGQDEKEYVMNLAISALHIFGLEADREMYETDNG